MRSSQLLKIGPSLLIIALNAAFFYAFAIGLPGVLTALIYFAAAVFLPGCFLFALFFFAFRSSLEEKPTWHLALPLSTMFGFANVLVSYLAGQLFHTVFYNFLFAGAYLIVLARPARSVLKGMIFTGDEPGHDGFMRNATVIFSFVLVVNILFFLLRPTPGILPLDIFHDHVWNVGNTVSLTSHFPLRSMNIEEQPYLAYHILIHILGAHMALVTGLAPHLVGLQFIFVPLIPLLVLMMAVFLKQVLDREDVYVFYGLAVLLFGGGFAVIHEVKVRSYLGSNTNLLGIILLFSLMAVMLRLKQLGKGGRFISLFVGLFLTTAAKGSIGAALVAGALLWVLFRIRNKQLTVTDTFDCLAAAAGFAGSFLLFFVLPVWGQPVFSQGTGHASFPLIPLAYVTKNDLALPFIETIYKYVPGHYRVPVHILFTVIFLLIYIPLYFSYRLLGIYDFLKNGMQEVHRKIAFVALGSLLIAYTVNTAPQENAYFLTSALFILDVFFIRYVQEERLFSVIRSSFHERRVYALIGALCIVSLPFLTVRGWVKPEHVYNFFTYGRIGKLLDHTFSKTSYRQNHQSITPEMYEALSYIRKNTDKRTIVVTPFIDEADGRHLAFYSSAFSERPAFIEGYEFGGIAREGLARYVGSSLINRRRETIKEIYTDNRVPEELQNTRYVLLVDAHTRMELEKKYLTESLFENNRWNVIRVAARQ